MHRLPHRDLVQHRQCVGDQLRAWHLQPQRAPGSLSDLCRRDLSGYGSVNGVQKLHGGSILSHRLERFPSVPRGDLLERLRSQQCEPMRTLPGWLGVCHWCHLACPVQPGYLCSGDEACCLHWLHARQVCQCHGRFRLPSLPTWLLLPAGLIDCNAMQGWYVWQRNWSWI